MTKNLPSYIGEFDLNSLSNRNAGIYSLKHNQLGRIGISDSNESFNFGINKGKNFNILPSPNILTESPLTIEIKSITRAQKSDDSSPNITFPADIEEGDFLFVWASGAKIFSDNWNVEYTSESLPGGPWTEHTPTPEEIRHIALLSKVATGSEANQSGSVFFETGEFLFNSMISLWVIKNASGIRSIDYQTPTNSNFILNITPEIGDLLIAGSLGQEAGSYSPSFDTNEFDENTGFVAYYDGYSEIYDGFNDIVGNYGEYIYFNGGGPAVGFVAAFEPL